MNREPSSSGWRRLGVVLPACLTWGALIGLAVLSIARPTVAALCLVTFEFYWMLRIFYDVTLLMLAYARLRRARTLDWWALCHTLPHWQDLWHVILFPIVAEGREILIASLDALLKTAYDHERFVVVLAVEERAGPSVIAMTHELQRRYASRVGAFLVITHPDGLPGEAQVKGANATYAAKQVRAWLDERQIPYERVILSCFDADTCAGPEYFACLSYTYLTTPNPTQASYQPIPVYNNNFWEAPAFARVMEVGASFWELIDGMRPHRFVTFSSHSLSFAALVAINYWPVDMVSDDSAVYWRAFLHYHGAYQVIPLMATVSMDIAVGQTLWQTLLVQYRQKRRWAWGVENFPMVLEGFAAHPEIAWWTKCRRAFWLLEGHWTWATWSIILTVIAQLPVIFGGYVFQGTVMGFQFPQLSGVLFAMTAVSLLLCVAISHGLLPKPPAGLPWWMRLSVWAQWLLVPLISAAVGSAPAVDAQTRLLFGHNLAFDVTMKHRKSSAQPSLAASTG